MQLYNKAAASCPSCMLAIILLRYAALEDLSDYWQQVDYLEMRHYLSKTRRKQALIALLSHWQTIICSQVKVIVSYYGFNTSCNLSISFGLITFSWFVF